MDFLLNFASCFSWAICPDFFLILEKKIGRIFYEYFSFSLTWDPMEAKISKHYSVYKSQPKLFFPISNFRIFFPMVLTKLRLGFLNAYEESPMTSSHLTFSDLERSNSRSLRF